MQFYSDELAMAVRSRRKQPTTETSTSVAARNRVSRSTIRPRYNKNNNNDSNNSNTGNNSNMSNRLFNPYNRSNNSHRPQETASRITARAQSRLTVRSAYRPRPGQQSAVSMPRSRVSVRSSVRSRPQEPDNASYLTESIYTSLSRASSRDTWEQGNWEEEDVPPAVLYNTTYSTASVDTYDSTLSDEEETHVNYGLESDGNSSTSSYSAGIPPAVLPPYQCVPMSETATVRSSDPESFAHLFPSMARLSIRHDERTADGNMNLRVDTIVPDPGSRRRRPMAVQLFHLRMHDLARRDFSLRRYCRDSGREVCSSKGATPRNPNDPRPGFQQSVTSAIRSMKTSFRRSNNAGGPSSVTGSPDPRRPSFASNNSWNCGAGLGLSASVEEEDGHDGSKKPPAQRPIPANTIKLEFSNYARVEIVRHRHKAYEFEWWGHKYAWRRVVDKGLGKIAYHLIRGGQGPPVAIIVPEGRSPTQVEADNHAGSWIPPCHMWISDRSVIEVMTDVADVVVATGLMALVDDCIRQRWPAKKPRSAVITGATPSRPQQQQQAQPQPQSQQQQQHQQQQQAPKQLKNLKRKQSTHANNTDLVRRRTFMHGLFQRQRQHHAAYSPLRIRNGVRPVTAY